MRKASFLFVGLIVVACGGSVTSVDGSANVTSLSASDQNQLCNDTYHWVVNNISTSDIQKLTCGFDFGSSQDQATCTASYNTCLSSTSTTQTTLPATPDCTNFAASVAKCNTTVATYTKCLQQEINALKDLEGQFPLCTQTQQQQAEIDEEKHFDSDCIILLENGCDIVVPVGSSSSSGSSNLDGG